MEVKKYFCLDLKHGTIVIGILESIISFILLILSAAYAEHPNEVMNPKLHSLTLLTIMFIIISFFSGILCISSIVAIFGAETNRPLMLMPFLLAKPGVVAFISLALLTIMISYGSSFTFGAVMGVIIGVTILIADGVHKILTVGSLYKSLKKLNF